MSILENPENEAAGLNQNRATLTQSAADASVEEAIAVPLVGQAVIASRTRRNWGEFGLALLYMAPALLIFVAFTFWPFIRSIWLSFFVTDAAGDTVRFNDIKYYSRILNLDGKDDDQYLKSIVTTVQFSLMVVPLGMVTAIALALLATVKVRAIQVFRTIFTSSVAISVASAGVIWAFIYSPSTKITQWLVDLLGVKQETLLQSPATALVAVAFMTVWTALGFTFIITLAGIQGIPQDLYESGRIDGTNGWSAFRYLTLPLLTPTLLFLFIISTIQCFQAFTQFKVLIGNEGPDGSTNVVVYALYNSFLGLGNPRYGFASAISVVLFLVLLVLTLIQFKALDRRVHYQ